MRSVCCSREPVGDKQKYNTLHSGLDKVLACISSLFSYSVFVAALRCNCSSLGCSKIKTIPLVRSINSTLYSTESFLETNRPHTCAVQKGVDVGNPK